METLSVKLASAFVIGLLGSAHCFAMCGGIVSALSLSHQSNERKDLPRQMMLLMGYNSGRIISYAVAGCIFGTFGWWLASIDRSLQMSLRYLAGSLLIAMGLYLANWWRGLVYLEQLGKYLWRYVQPFAIRWVPVKTLLQAFMTGLLWGWLPCGLVYSTLFWSASDQSGPLETALLMASFGAGTLPSMLVTGFMAGRLQSFINAALTRNIAAIMMIIFGFWTMPAISHLLMPM